VEQTIMPSWLLQSGWVEVIFSIIAIVVGVAVSVFVYRRQRQFKSITYRVVASNRLVSVEDAVSDSVQLVYDGDEVNDVHLLQIAILNQGNMPITRQDFEQPLSFDVGEGASILNHEIVECKPAGMGVKLATPADHKVTIDPLLLNAGDEFTFQLLLTGYDNEKSLTHAGRIVGVDRIGKSEAGSTTPFPIGPFTGWFELLAVIGITLAIGIFLLSILTGPPSPPLPSAEWLLTEMVYYFEPAELTINYPLNIWDASCTTIIKSDGELLIADETTGHNQKYELPRDNIGRLIEVQVNCPAPLIYSENTYFVLDRFESIEIGR